MKDLAPSVSPLNQRKAKQNLRIPKPCASTGLVPDEPRIAERVRLALDGDSLPDHLQEARGEFGNRQELEYRETDYPSKVVGY